MWLNGMCATNLLIALESIDIRPMPFSAIGLPVAYCYLSWLRDSQTTRYRHASNSPHTDTQMNKPKLLTDLQIRSLVSARYKCKTNKRHDLVGLFWFPPERLAEGGVTQSLGFRRYDQKLQVNSEHFGGVSNG